MPESSQAYNDQAATLCERGKETGKVSFFTQAEAALQKSFRLAPNDYSAQKLHVSVLLGLHQWVAAWQAAKALNHLVPDDVAGWGLLAQTNLALGNYPEAQKAAQWMFDLRPGNAAAFLPAAQIREAYGDIDGAIDFVNEALRRVPESEQAKRAFLTADLARLYLLRGDSVSSQTLLKEALLLSPSSPHALKVSALLEKAGGRFSEAASLLERRYDAIETTSALYDYAEALNLAGQKAGATAAFRKFESEAVAESAQPYNANLELVFYYADHASQPAKALQVAKLERALRHDIATLDAYAWALFRSGNLDEARSEIALARATGTRDPEVLSHAKQILGARQ